MPRFSPNLSAGRIMEPRRRKECISRHRNLRVLRFCRRLLKRDNNRWQGHEYVEQAIGGIRISLSSHTIYTCK